MSKKGCDKAERRGRTRTRNTVEEEREGEKGGKRGDKETQVQRDYGEQFHREEGETEWKLIPTEGDVDLKDVNVGRSNGVSLRGSSCVIYDASH